MSAGPVVTISSQTESTSSVTITGRAKGAPSVEVKVYSSDPEEAARKAVELYERIEARYRHLNDGSTPVKLA